MAATTNEREREAARTAEPLSPAAYHAAEGFAEAQQSPERRKVWREWMMVGLGLTALLAVLGTVVAVAALVIRDDGGGTQTVTVKAPAAAAPAADKRAPTLADAKGIR